MWILHTSLWQVSCSTYQSTAGFMQYLPVYGRCHAVPTSLWQVSCSNYQSTAGVMQYPPVYGRHPAVPWTPVCLPCHWPKWAHRSISGQPGERCHLEPLGWSARPGTARSWACLWLCPQQVPRFPLFCTKSQKIFYIHLLWNNLG